jgi:hypothetical protein
LAALLTPNKSNLKDLGLQQDTGSATEIAAMVANNFAKITPK